MNHRERFHAVMEFNPVDRLPRIEWACWWGDTIQRWLGEGLDAPTERYALCEHFGLDPYFQWWFPPRAQSLPEPPGHGKPIVTDVAGYEAALEHLYPEPGPPFEQIRPWAVRQERGDAVIWISLEGFFWFPRTLLGIEQHLYAFYDKPDLIHRINQDLADYYLALLARLREFCRPDFMTFGEDMSYNMGPMLSKDQFTEFLAPYYRRLVPVLKEMGTRVFVDTDGDCAAMLSWLEDVGAQGVLPLERQAGTDAASIRAQHPRLSMIGHYDKMVMPHGEQAMREEFERLLPVMQSGGFIPSVDHQTPPGVSLELYRVFLRLLAEYTELAAR